MRLLVCIDGSDDARVALERAAHFAKAGGYQMGYHKLFVVHVGEGGTARALLDDELHRQADALDGVWHEAHALARDGDESVAECLLRARKEHGCGRVFAGRRGRKPGVVARLGGSPRGCGHTTNELIESVPHGTKVHVCALGSDDVQIFPLKALSEEERAKLEKRARQAGLSKPPLVVRVFERFDDDESQCLDNTELDALLRALGVDIESKEVVAIREKIDEDGSGTIEFNEYLKLLKELEAAKVAYDLDEASAVAEKKSAKSLLNAPAEAVKKTRRRSVEFAKKLLPGSSK